MSKSSSERQQSKVFGEVAEIYHRVRPGYPEDLYDWILETSRVDDGELLIDVGCGTGKASIPFVRRGFTVVGIEPDPMMARIASRELNEFDTFSIEQCTLDDFGNASSEAGLMYAGQSWHWMNPDTRFECAASALRPDGWLCVFWNRPEEMHHSFDLEMDAVYEELAPQFNDDSFKVRLPGSKSVISADSPIEEFDLSRFFGDVHTFEASWEQTISSEEHVQNLLTQSDHRMLEEELRTELLGRVGEVINNAGGGYKQLFTTHAYAAKLSV
tara:strand:- start:15441 stop:16253 length:813 start_codon:yes stop_codon:yes gene_type:complete